VICNRCGYFRIEHGALQGFEQHRHLIAGMTRRSFRLQRDAADSRLTLTRDIPYKRYNLSRSGKRPTGWAWRRRYAVDHLDQRRVSRQEIPKEIPDKGTAGLIRQGHGTGH
jgi:hypothetical protein